MAKHNPYDAFGRILESGGDQSLALSYFYGKSEDDISALRARRFGGIDDNQFDDLSKLALAGLNAGRLANTVLPDEQIPLSAIPVNSAMGGDDAEGQRTRWIGEVEFEGGDKPVRVYGWFPGIPTSQELYDAIEANGRNVGERYPTKFGLVEGAPIEVIDVTVIYTARRF